MFITPKRCREVKFSEPTFGIKQTFIVPKGNHKGVVTYDTIRDNDLKLAVISGTAHLEYARKSGIPEGNILQFPDNPTSLAAIEVGRADAYGLSRLGIREILQTEYGQNFEAVPPFTMVAGEPAVAHGAFAFRKDDTEFVEQFNTVLANFMGTTVHLEMVAPYDLKEDELPISSEKELCGS